jgi:Phage gp6-like head-tail connector protein
MMPAVLVTLEMAKQQLRITDALHDDVVAWKLAQAEDVILRYLKPMRTDEPRPEYPWTIANVPPAVQDAILLYLVHLERNRGDALEDGQDEELWRAIDRRTAQLRDKALA